MGCRKGRAALKGGLHINRAGRRDALNSRLAGCTKRPAAEQGGPADCTLVLSCTTERAGGCTKRRAGGLHNRAGRRAALKGGPAGCRKRRAAEQGGPAGCRTGRAAHIYLPAGCSKRAGRSIAGRTVLKLIILASFRRSSRYTKRRTVRCKGGLH